MRKRGFTLIELIVVMAIISILVLLGVPKYKEYTNQARLTKLTVESKELEKASQKYYIVNNDWPQLMGTSYSKAEVTAFGEKIYNSTGKVVELETGNYYDIDYNKIGKYISKPSNPENYVLQNPVGNVYSIDKPTEVAKIRLETVESEQPEQPEEPSKLGQVLINPEVGWKRIDDTDASINYLESNLSAWGESTDIYYYNKTIHYNWGITTGVIKFNFSGSKIRLILANVNIGEGYGINNTITIDGVIYPLYTLKQNDKKVVGVDIKGLEYKKHNVIININSSRFGLDAVDIDSDGFLTTL